MKRIFVSSTFRDMQYERDLFHTEIMPKLNEYARQYGESVSFCDLRWGINTVNSDSESGAKKVLSVCLDEIDRCDKSGSQPYIIVLLGNRYGWIPDPALMQSETQRKNFALEDLRSSVTALEIEYGALRDRAHLNRTLFYFREFDQELPKGSKYAVDGSTDAERIEYKKRLEDLKEKIRKATGNRVKTYHVHLADDGETVEGLEDFADQVTKDIHRLLEKEWLAYKRISPHEKLIRFQWNIVEQKSAQFGARADLVEDIIATLKKNENHIGIRGQTGSGKSTLISRLAYQLKEQSYEVLPLFCASHTQLNQATDIMRCIVYDLETRMRKPHLEDTMRSSDDHGSMISVEKWRERLAELSIAYDGRDLIVMVDAVDQLFEDEYRDNVIFLPARCSEKLHFVVSMQDEYVFPEGMTDRLQLVLLHDLSRIEIYKSMQSILSYLGRELEPAVMKKIAEKRKVVNPLYLSLILQRLVMMDKHDFESIHLRGDDDRARADYKIEIIHNMSDSLTEICYDIINESSLRIGGAFSKSALEYLALSKSGLRESDLEEIFSSQGLEWNSLDFSLLINYIQGFFLIREDGRISFTHRTIREGILAHCTDQKEKHLHIRQHLHQLEWSDPVSIDETVYQCYYADDKEYFVWYISNITKNDESACVEVAAKSFYELVCKHGSNWFMTLLQQNGNDGFDTNFYTFFYSHAKSHFEQSTEKYEIIISILQALANSAAASCSDNSSEFLSAMENLNLYLGNCFSEIYKYDIAEKHYLEAMRYHSLLKPKQEELDSYESDLAKLYNSYALLLQSMKQPIKAMQYFESALQLREKHSEQSPLLAVSYYNLACQFFEIDQYKEAIPFLRKAIGILEVHASSNEASHAKNLINFYSKLALTYRRLNKKEESLSYIEKTVALTQKYMLLQPMEFEIMLAHTYNEKGIILSDQKKDCAEAIECFQNAICIMEKYFEQFPEKYEPMLAIFYCNLANAYDQIGNYALCENTYVSGIHHKEHLYTLDSESNAMSLADSYNNLGVLMTKQRRNGEARRYFLLAIEISESCSMEERYLKRDYICQYYQNAAYVFGRVLRPMMALKYRSYAEILKKDMTFDKFKKFCLGKDFSNKFIWSRRANDTLHPFIKLSMLSNIAFIVLFFYLLIEGYGPSPLLLGIIVQYAAGFLAAIVGMKEIAMKGKQKALLWILWYLSAGLTTGWLLALFILPVKADIRCGISAKASSKAKHKKGRGSVGGIQKRIDRLVSENKKLEAKVKKNSALKFHIKIVLLLIVNGSTSYLVLPQIIRFGERVAEMRRLKEILDGFDQIGSSISTDYVQSKFAGELLGVRVALFFSVVLVIVHLIVVFLILKNIWILRNGKRICLLGLSVCTFGIGTCLFYLLLYKGTFRSHDSVRTVSVPDSSSAKRNASNTNRPKQSFTSGSAKKKRVKTTVRTDPVTLQLQKNKDEIAFLQIELAKKISQQ